MYVLVTVVLNITLLITDNINNLIYIYCKLLFNICKINVSVFRKVMNTKKTTINDYKNILNCLKYKSKILFHRQLRHDVNFGLGILCIIEHQKKKKKN